MKLINNHNLDHDSYYIDTEHVTNSMLNNLTGKSPEYFKHIMENPQPASAAMRFGSALHMQVLQPEEYSKHYVMMLRNYCLMEKKNIQLFGIMKNMM